MAAFLLIFAILGVFHRLAFREYLSDIFDVPVSFGEPIYAYDSPRSFNGDGYSIEVFTLPANVAERFRNSDDRLLSDFPKRPHYRSHWSVRHWTRSPFDPQLAKYLDFALSTYAVREQPELLEHFEAIRSALAGSTSFYALFSYDHGDYPGNIDLFVVDLERDRVYTINHNT